LAQAARKTHRGTAPTSRQPGAREGALIVLGAIAVYLLVSLLSYHHGDPGWSHTGPRGVVQNVGGAAGPGSPMCSCICSASSPCCSDHGRLQRLADLAARARTATIDYHTLALRWLGFLVTVGAGCGLAACISMSPRANCRCRPRHSRQPDRPGSDGSVQFGWRHPVLLALFLAA